MSKRLYFAYGSNMNEAQMALRCPGSTSLGIAWLANHRFIINARGVASIVESEGSIVYGLLWEIGETDEKQLDRYEGVAKGFYRKSTVSVGVNEKQTVDALVYIASANEHGKPRPGYMEGIIRAATNLDFPTQVLEELKAWLVTDVQSA